MRSLTYFVIVAFLLAASASAPAPASSIPKDDQNVTAVDGRVQSLGEFHDNKEWLQFINNLVKKYYPAVLSDLNLPDGYTLAFVLKDRDTALRHTSIVLHEPIGTTLPQTLSRVFPDAMIDPQSPMEQGSLCVKEVPGKHGRYCVYYVVAPL